MPHKDAAGGDAEVRSPCAPEDAAPPLREPLAHRDPGQFAQVQRSVVVSLRAILGVTRRVTYGDTRGDTQIADIELKGRPERRPVSRSHLPMFKEM